MLTTIVLIMLLAWLVCTALMAVRAGGDSAQTDAGESLAGRRYITSPGRTDSGER